MQTTTVVWVSRVGQEWKDRLLQRLSGRVCLLEEVKRQATREAGDDLSGMKKRIESPPVASGVVVVE